MEAAAGNLEAAEQERAEAERPAEAAAEGERAEAAPDRRRR